MKKVIVVCILSLPLVFLLMRTVVSFARSTTDTDDKTVVYEKPYFDDKKQVLKKSLQHAEAEQSICVETMHAQLDYNVLPDLPTAEGLKDLREELMKALRQRPATEKAIRDFWKAVSVGGSFDEPPNLGTLTRAQAALNEYIQSPSSNQTLRAIAKHRLEIVMDAQQVHGFVQSRQRLFDSQKWNECILECEKILALKAGRRVLDETQEAKLACEAEIDWRERIARSLDEVRLSETQKLTLIDDHLKNHPRSRHAEEARERKSEIQSERSWKELPVVPPSDRDGLGQWIDKYGTFVRSYPQSTHSDEARKRVLDSLTRELPKKTLTGEKMIIKSNGDVLKGSFEVKGNLVTYTAPDGNKTYFAKDELRKGPSPVEIDEKANEFNVRRFALPWRARELEDFAVWCRDNGWKHDSERLNQLAGIVSRNAELFAAQ
jgi:hypothetical protein